MKIYQIHECSGEYTDYTDRIRFSYLDKNKAEEKLLELEKQDKIDRMCEECPLYRGCPQNCVEDCDNCTESKIKRAKEYCSRCDTILVETDPEWDNDVSCKNHCYHEGSTFRINEVDVIE